MRRDHTVYSATEDVESGGVQDQVSVYSHNGADHLRAPENVTPATIPVADKEKDVSAKPADEKKIAKDRVGAALLSALCYSGCSISMVLVNKGIFSKFDYPHSFSVLAMQGAIACIWLLLSHQTKTIKLRPLSKEVLKQWLPVNVLFIAMLYTSFQSLKLLAVPLVTIFKNLTNLVVLYGEWFFFRERCDGHIVASLCVVVAGAVLAGWTDIHFSMEGYVWMLLNCVATASYVLYLRAAVKLELSTHDKALYNNMLMIPFSLFLAFSMNELPGAFQSEEWNNPSFIATIVFSGSVGFLLNLASIWCVAATSASTYSMIGALNKVPLSVLGVLLFNEPITFGTATFISMSLLGGVMYAKARQRNN